MNPHEQERSSGRPRRPQVFGHRGNMALCPENTLGSIRHCIDEGAQGVEFDVQPSRDGRAVVMHDDRLDRTTAATGPVLEADAAVIAGLDAGAWRGPRFRGERVPFLEDVLAIAPPGFQLAVEIKRVALDDEGMAAFTRSVCGAIAARGLTAQCWMLSFDRVCLDAARAVLPDVRTTLNLMHEKAYIAAFRDAFRGLSAVSMPLDMFTRERVAELHAFNRSAFAWALQTEEHIRKGNALGIDVLIADNPGMAVSVLRMPTASPGGKG